MADITAVSSLYAKLRQSAAGCRFIFPVLTFSAETVQKSWGTNKKNKNQNFQPDLNSFVSCVNDLQELLFWSFFDLFDM